ncbi:response regulator transcription factor [Clostridium botulinum]|uniref:response regulator transcription factor n=1 Tax=Clostridium botulinum TaxID=1491 RepID=UPI001A927D42|nr:response regulator transcription factor [Clostridium botulinum]MBO0525078.1 response regulator transcription factor [Clostridium botulinum]MBO0528555.1 response regulator transcription factor [Clostridium botulinum]MBO0531191.1 response regulator transcription factor [Clostridium botulinum]MBO0542767.1 response regulator transcription factor [Clostridium botulinum]MBO0545681.1 response regulator transcription factor [Clostridium botulinum]
MKNILVVEDDNLLNKTLSYNLKQEGYTVDCALIKRQAVEYINKREYDLIILDINLPDGDGFDLCPKIKSKHKNTAVFFLTAKDMENDMIKGFDLGADDYITKPFHISVFKKKVKVLFNKIKNKAHVDCYDDGKLYINFSNLKSTLNGEPIIFTPMEYRTLKILVKNPKIVLTRQMLLEKIWDVDENFVDEHTLTTVISRIRNKIEAEETQYIKTVYGMGYMWIGDDRK